MIFIIFTHYDFGNSTRDLFVFPFIISMAVPMLILLSGFNYANSYLGGNINIVKTFLKRVLRLSIPVAIILILEIQFILGGHFLNYFLHCHIKGVYFLTGGLGPGSYYFPVMLQFIVLFPVLYTVIFKYQKKALIGIFLINLLYEIICAFLQIDFKWYRILCFRLLIFFAVGIWFALNKDFKNKPALFISVLIGAIYIYIYKYFNGTDWKIFQSIGSTSMMVIFYLFPIQYFIYNKLKDSIIPIKYLDQIFSLIGKASWHIFTVQMMYFITVEKDHLLHHLPFILHMAFNIVFCVVIGILFYKAETFITQFIINLFKKKT